MNLNKLDKKLHAPPPLLQHFFFLQMYPEDTSATRFSALFNTFPIEHASQQILPSVPEQQEQRRHVDTEPGTFSLGLRYVTRGVRTSRVELSLVQGGSRPLKEKGKKKKDDKQECAVRQLPDAVKGPLPSRVEHNSDSKILS